MCISVLQIFGGRRWTAGPQVLGNQELPPPSLKPRGSFHAILHKEKQTVITKGKGSFSHNVLVINEKLLME